MWPLFDINDKFSPSSSLADLGDQQSRTHGNETLNDRANIMRVASLLLERILARLPINKLVERSKLKTTMYDSYSLISSAIFTGFSHWVLRTNYPQSALF